MCYFSVGYKDHRRSHTHEQRPGRVVSVCYELHFLRSRSTSLSFGLYWQREDALESKNEAPQNSAVWHWPRSKYRYCSKVEVLACTWPWIVKKLSPCPALNMKSKGWTTTCNCDIIPNTRSLTLLHVMATTCQHLLALAFRLLILRMRDDVKYQPFGLSARSLSVMEQAFRLSSKQKPLIISVGEIPKDFCSRPTISCCILLQITFCQHL